MHQERQQVLMLIEHSKRSEDQEKQQSGRKRHDGMSETDGQTDRQTAHWECMVLASTWKDDLVEQREEGPKDNQADQAVMW